MRTLTICTHSGTKQKKSGVYDDNDVLKQILKVHTLLKIDENKRKNVSDRMLRVVMHRNSCPDDTATFHDDDDAVLSGQVMHVAVGVTGITIYQIKYLNPCTISLSISSSFQFIIDPAFQLNCGGCNNGAMLGAPHGESSDLAPFPRRRFVLRIEFSTDNLDWITWQTYPITTSDACFEWKAEFGSLAVAIALRLSIAVLQAENSSGSHISVTTRLACTLRWVAGGSHHDISGLFGVSPANVFHFRGVIWPTAHAINDLFDIDLSLNPDDLEASSKGFAQLT